MNELIKIRKLSFNEENPRKEISYANRGDIPKFATGINLELLEIECDNPNDIIIIITKEANGHTTEIPYYLYKGFDKIIHRGNKFLLKLEIPLHIQLAHYTIEIITEQTVFDINYYYSLIN